MGSMEGVIVLIETVGMWCSGRDTARMVSREIGLEPQDRSVNSVRQVKETDDYADD